MEKTQKFIVGIIVSLFLLNSIAVANNGSFRSTERSKLTSNSTGNGNEFISSTGFDLEDITPKDDAFHGSNGFALEWWYFDAIFDNNYSFHVGITTFSIRGYGIISPALEIYEDMKLAIGLREIYPFHHFQISKEIPFIKLFGETILEFNQDRYDDTGEWVYNVSLRMDGQEINLQFIGTTKGWKTDGWAVSLPKADVNGTMIINGNCIEVNGIGYHDHNWNYSISAPIEEYGWYWGKIAGNALNVVWAKTMRIPWKEQIIVVLNRDQEGRDQGGYINIEPENIHFDAKDYIWDHGWIPTKFCLCVHDDFVDINVTMETLNIHHTNWWPIARYWRYHVRTSGYICLHSDNETVNETVNKIQIMEFMDW